MHKNLVCNTRLVDRHMTSGLAIQHYPMFQNYHHQVTAMSRWTGRGAREKAWDVSCCPSLEAALPFWGNAKIQSGSYPKETRKCAPTVFPRKRERSLGNTYSLCPLLSLWGFTLGMLLLKPQTGPSWRTQPISEYTVSKPATLRVSVSYCGKLGVTMAWQPEAKQLVHIVPTLHANPRMPNSVCTGVMRTVS